MYRLTASGLSVERMSDAVRIPLDVENRDFQVYEDWRAAGNTPLPAPAIDYRAPVLADFLARREVYLNRLTGIAGRAARSLQPLIADAADAFAKGLLDLPAHPDVVAATAACVDAAGAEALRRAIYARYVALREVAKTTPGAKGEFDKVDRA